MAVKGMGASMPESAEDQERVKLVLLTSWLHSRDIEYMMLALGYKVITTGLHDLEEYVLSDEIKVRIGEAHSAGKSYSEWVLCWVESLPAGEMINVGCFNAALTVSMYERGNQMPQIRTPWIFIACPRTTLATRWNDTTRSRRQ